MPSALLTIAHEVAATVQQASANDQPFHDVAAAAIASTNACARLSRLDLFREVANTPLPPAIGLENDFAYPTITICREQDFRVELLFWRRGSEAYVHDHMAGGAFGIVVGRRVHAQFKFHVQAPEPAPGVSTGTLTVDEARVRGPGYVCAIPPHDGLIHSLYYLDDVAITLSIRQICDINTTAAGPGAIAYKPHEGHYLSALRLRAGMGADSRKLAAFIESSLSANDGTERLPALIRDLAERRPAAQLLAAASTETLALNTDLTGAICEALGHRHPCLAVPVTDSLHWFGDKARLAMIGEHLDETERLTAWLLAMLCPRAMAIEVLSHAIEASLQDAEQLLLSAVGKLHQQEIDFGSGPEPLIRSAPLLRTLESYGIATDAAARALPANEPS